MRITHERAPAAAPGAACALNTLAEVCQGFAVCRVLLEHGCLTPDKGRAFDTKARLPGLGNSWCYRIAPAIFDLDF